MKSNICYLLVLCLFSGCVKGQSELDNVFYAFNNAVRSLPNAPGGMDAQAKFIKEIGFDGFSGHHSEDYFARRKAMDKVGLSMPEIYLPVTINADGSATFKEDLYDIIKDARERNLLIALAAFSDDFKDNKEEGDKYLVKAIQELVDHAASYNVKIAVYPHANFYCERLDHSIKIAKMVDRPNVGAIFNTCHLFKVEGTDNWEKKLKEAIPFLYMISINGLDDGDTQSMDWDRLIKPLGEGSFDTYKIVKVAKDHGYEGPFGLQCYNIKQDCKKALTTSMNTWKTYQRKYAEN
ncbi:MAG: sugar phosphate isomerase/epimerase family protein [Bacteroidota bacterium]